jgi:hypothetical protein
MIYVKGSGLDLYLGFEDDSLLPEDYGLHLSFSFKLLNETERDTMRK